MGYKPRTTGKEKGQAKGFKPVKAATRKGARGGRAGPKVKTTKK